MDYIGIGPGAHGRYKTDSSVVKTFRILDPNGWMRSVKEIGHGIRKSQSVDDEAQTREIAVLGLRTLEGISMACTKDILDIEKTNELVKCGFLRFSENGNRLIPTSKGLQVMDSVLPVIFK